MHLKNVHNINGDMVKKEEYLKLVEKVTPKENKMENAINSFVMGGVLGFLAECIKLFLVNVFSIPVRDAIGWMLLIFIFLATLFTSLGFMDSLVSKFKSGLIIPITGFAHSITSSILDYRKDGFVTGIGSNVFKLAGSVLLYGILFAFIMAIVKVILYV